ncbi:hypothetical protein GCM10009632_11710 [Mycolicibacterium alvei]|uniref:Uncharacterized protein n=1 Tax=Mycolicibacterium alvei TaxID=67081 RepID=A0A6N4UU75_9MYCO|nr:hypothetical protein MALV_30840 [Mycolicibacterium alvei]
MTTTGDLPAKYRDAAVITFEHHAIKMASKITASKVNPLTGDVTLTLMPFEGLIHPYPLLFDPPLIEHAVGKNNGFAHRWEMLSYAFALPDPADFPALAGLTDDDKTVLRRYAKVCRRLAGYSALNDETGLSWSVKKGGQPDVKLSFPTEEAFGGTSLAFRQLHSDDETASFSRTKGLLMKAIKLLPAAEQEAPKNVVTQWAKARGKLMNRLLENIVATKVGKSGPHPAPDDFPFSYCNIDPQKLILTFNYGDTIHFSGEQESLSELLEVEANAAYYRHAVLLAITSLSHLYFGFAVLAEAAMADAS